MKNTLYFSHDYHARYDPKIQAFIKTHGMVGYGVYWNLIEILHEQGGYIEKFPLLLRGLASELSIAEAPLQAIIRCLIDEVCLFKENSTHIWSDRVLCNIQTREEKRMQKVESGRLGGIKSGEKRKQNEAPLQANEANEANKSKVKNIKEYKRYVEVELPLLPSPDQSLTKVVQLPTPSTNKTIPLFFEYYLLKTKRQFRLTEQNISLIENRLKDGYTLEQLKTAVDNFILDDWPDRKNRLDLIYCIGKQRGKPDALERWLNFKPQKKGIQV